MKKLVVLLLSSSSLVACMRKDTSDSPDSAAAAADSQEAVGDEADIMTASVDASGTVTASVDAASAASTIAANLAAKWTGACAVATASGANVTVTYNDCTGPYGLVHVTGELDLTISINAQGALAVHATANDLEVNAATLDFTADGTLSESGTMKTLSVTANGTGTGPRGNAIDHNGAYTVTWDPTSACRSISGSWSTDLTSPVATAERANTVDLMRCGAACPTGTMAHKFLGGSTLSVTFDGTATAAWSSSLNLSGTIALDCTP
ncbi:MAG TPA: hypothetical protein VH143_20035 [Kofleriaceae bacterium]|jgi:hypothetical protein|nr:hypothetical protein [Kofleriaceae bacterium]